MLTGSARRLLAVQLHVGEGGTNLERFLELAGGSAASTAATAAGAASVSRSRLAPEACTIHTAVWWQQAELLTPQAAWSTVQCEAPQISPHHSRHLHMHAGRSICRAADEMDLQQNRRH